MALVATHPVFAIEAVPSGPDVAPVRPQSHPGSGTAAANYQDPLWRDTPLNAGFRASRGSLVIRASISTCGSGRSSVVMDPGPLEAISQVVDDERVRSRVELI
jgi:hypothetical protein